MMTRVRRGLPRRHGGSFKELPRNAGDDDYDDDLRGTRERVVRFKELPRNAGDDD